MAQSRNSAAEGFVPVRVTTLRPGVPLLFSAFVHFEDRYLEYRRAEQIFEAALLEKFQKKKVKKVFIRVDDEPKYLEYLDAALNELTESTAPISARADFAAEAMASEAENAEKNLDTEEGYKASTQRLSKVIDFISQEGQGLQAMLAAAGVSVDNSAHSSTVASLTVALASRGGVDDKEELTAISIAALLHDNGLKKLGFDPAVLPEDLPKEKLASYRKHPEASVEIVAGKKYITPRVLRIISDHHEVGEGLGFPEKKRIAKLPLSSQFFNLADAFDHFSMSIQKPAAEAFEPFVEKYEKYFDMKHLELLEKALKAQ